MRRRVLACVLLAAAACRGPAREAAVSPIAEPGAGARTVGQQAELEGAVIDRFETDQLRQRARIQRAHLDRQAGQVRGEGIHAEVYTRGVCSAPPCRELVVDAPRGDSALEQRTLHLEGGVVLTDALGRALHTAVLDYDARQDLLSAPSAVEVLGENFRAEASGLRGHPQLGQLELAPPFKATVTSRRGAR